jgi:hypothetical protein
MYRLVLLAGAVTFRPGAQALTLGQLDADPDEARSLAAVQETCLAAVGLPDCPKGRAWGDGVDSKLPQTGCIDAAQLAEDMGELGFGVEGCARALKTNADARGDPMTKDPELGQVAPANVPHTKPVVWVHIHKSMGTFIYSLARLNGENVVRPSFNGNWWPCDVPDAVRKGKAHHCSCQRRTEFFEWSNVTWAQIEHDMDDYNLCHEDFNYGILLRDPNQLAISKASMEKYTPDETNASLSCLVGREDDELTEVTRACNSAAPVKSDWRLWWFYDNFLVRTLGGQSVWNLPAGGITEEHAHKAIERLSKFQIVMFGEDFKETEHLKDAIGWRPEYFEKGFKRPSSHVVKFTDEQDGQARHTNRFDYMVYDHFRSMSIEERIKKFQ